MLTGSALVATLPFLYFHSATGAWLPRILPQLSSDSLYYLKQIREVMDGHPWLGNPFIREYASARFPGLILPIWIGAVPGLLAWGALGVNGVFAFNVVAYHLLAGAVFFLLLRRLTGGRVWLAAALTLVAVASLHGLLIRPILQIVYPALAAFLLALLGVLEHPRDSWRYVLLGALSIVAFYLYPHLWMPTFAALGFLTLRALWLRDRPAMLRVAAMWAGIVLLCVPQIRIILSLFSDPLAAELNVRSGLVETHRVLPLTIFNLKYMILLVGGLLFLRTRRALSRHEVVLLLIGGGILAAGFSNVVTGKEMDLDTHPLWMAFFVNVAAIAVMAASFLNERANPGRASASRTIVGMLLAAFVFTTTARIVRNAFPYPVTGITTPRPIQDFARVFDFLERDRPGQHVILAPNLLGSYVPLHTDDYLLYSRYAVLHVIPTEELMERLLVQRVDTITEKSFTGDLGAFLGWGIGRAWGYRAAYGEEVSELDLAGGPALVQRALALHRDISARYEDYLRKYHVAYVITDAQADDNPRVPKGAEVAFKDERFTVYRLR